MKQNLKLDLTEMFESKKQKYMKKKEMNKKYNRCMYTQASTQPTHYIKIHRSIFEM